jgi:5-oxoprolinase (ATP-hydrolysing)
LPDGGPHRGVMSDPQWSFFIDRGGTFTDVVARSPDGALSTAKLLSENPGRYPDAAVAAIRRLTGVGDGPLPPCAVRIGTTVATNALLERKGVATCFVTTRGHGDALLIGYQNRPDIFVRDIRRPPPLAARVIEVDERVTAAGAIDQPLDLADAEAALRAAYAAGLRSVGIALVAIVSRRMRRRWRRWRRGSASPRSWKAIASRRSSG